MSQINIVTSIAFCIFRNTTMVSELIGFDGHLLCVLHGVDESTAIPAQDTAGLQRMDV